MRNLGVDSCLHYLCLTSCFWASYGNNNRTCLCCRVMEKARGIMCSEPLARGQAHHQALMNGSAISIVTVIIIINNVYWVLSKYRGLLFRKRGFLCFCCFWLMSMLFLFFLFQSFKHFRVQYEIKRKQIEHLIQPVHRDGKLSLDQALVKQSWERVSSRVSSLMINFIKAYVL